jgi:hypothetical protein
MDTFIKSLERLSRNKFHSKLSKQLLVGRRRPSAPDSSLRHHKYLLFSKFLRIPMDSPWKITKGIVDSFWILFRMTLHTGERMWCSLDPRSIGYDVPLTSNPSDTLFLWSLTHLLWCSFDHSLICYDVPLISCHKQPNKRIYFFYITLPTVEWICEIDRARRARSGISSEANLAVHDIF